MMNFRTIKDSIINILGTAEAGRFRTIGFQRQTKSAEEVKGNLRLVTVYYSAGTFPKRSGRNTGAVQHDITYRIEFTVSKSALGNLAIINNPESTPAEITTAIDAIQESAKLADESIDELFEIIYQILMDARNIDMGLSVGTVADRWIDSIQKDEPRPKGDLVVLTGSANLTLRTAEQVTGDPGIPDANIIDGILDIKENVPDITGVLIDNS